MRSLRRITLLLTITWVGILIGCSTTSTPLANEEYIAPTTIPLLSFSTITPAPAATQVASPSTEEIVATPIPTASTKAGLLVQVDTRQNIHPISPLIYGLSDVSYEYATQLRTTLASWGGNPSTRYNWRLGDAWNSGSDWFYRNGNYGYTGNSASDEFITRALAAGMAVRLALPTLGWVAKNDDNNTCSFPLADGSCSDADGANCQNPGRIADPTLANVPSDTESVRAWLEYLFNDQGFDIRFLAMDNEPELWGITHYDVHPECTTYAEILDKFLTYAMVARSVAPEAEITGPVTCCWYYFWNSPAGEDDRQQHGDQEFLPWFLEKVREHDEANNQRTLDVLDIHYYPEGVYNDYDDEIKAAHRLRSTRSLWDKNYIDESWIEEPIYLIPTMKALIEEHYPGTKLGISEWNWGADKSMNGALAIADVLGIFGREDLYFAAYWRQPPVESPGFYAFKIYTNYDDQGARFGDTSVWAETNDSDLVSAYAAMDSPTGNLHLMLINKDPQNKQEIRLDLINFAPQTVVAQYKYDASQPKEITQSEINLDAELPSVTLPAYSITLLVMAPEI